MNDVPTSFTGQRGNLTQLAGLDQDPVPLYPYRSQAFFELERDRVFRRAWLMIGRVEELAESGSFMQVQDSEICIRHSVNQIIRWVQADTVKEALS